MNHMDEVTRGTFLRAKQEVTVAIDLLNWLTGHGIRLPELEQSHLDVWQAEGPTTRRIAERFLKWAIRTKAALSGLALVPHRRGTSPRLARPGQDEALKRVVHDDGLETRDRAAAMLILVFGQQAEDIAWLTWDDVTITEELVTIQLGTIQIALPDPLNRPWRELAANSGRDLTASHPNTSRVFRAASPGASYPPRAPHNTPQQTVQHPGRTTRNPPRTPNSLPLPSSPKPSDTPLPPSNATPPTRPPLTLDVSPRRERSGKSSEHAVVVCAFCELFPAHIGDVQVVLDSPEFTRNATKRLTRLLVQINHLDRISRPKGSAIHYKKDRHLAVGRQSSLADLPPAGAIPSLVINHFYVSAETVFVLRKNNRQYFCPKFVVGEGSAHQEGIFCAWRHQHDVIETQ